MGVRGTNFVVKVEGDRTTMHTLPGLVEVARDYSTLLRGGGGRGIPTRKFVVAITGRNGLEESSEFDVDSYIEDFDSRNPQTGTLFRQAIKAYSKEMGAFGTEAAKAGKGSDLEFVGAAGYIHSGGEYTAKDDPVEGGAKSLLGDGLKSVLKDASKKKQPEEEERSLASASALGAETLKLFLL